MKFFQITRLSLVSINHAYRKPVSKLFLHDFGYLVATLLMVTTTCGYQCFYKIGIYITLWNYEILACFHLQRYASIL